MTSSSLRRPGQEDRCSITDEPTPTTQTPAAATFTGTGAAGGVAALTGTVPAGGYFVVQLNSNGTTGAPLPSADQVTTLAPSGTAGTVFLARSTTGINPDSPPEQVVDKLGYGTSNSPEGVAEPYPGSNSTAGSLSRTSSTDTDTNRTDFSFTATVTPGAANSTTPAEPSPSPSTSPTVSPTTTPSAEVVPIASIQGIGASTPLSGRRVSTVGVVTANYPTGGFDGFYLQTPGSGGAADTTPGASDGIFVYGRTDVRVGDCYVVTGTATEYNGLTQLASNPTLTPKADCEPVKAVDLPSLPATDAAKEQYEGMLVHPGDRYTITNNYQLNQYGQLGLAVGDKPLYTATDVVRPGPEAVAYEQQNLAKYITLDDGSNWDYLRNATAQASPLPYLSQATPMRTGAAATFTQPVILDYRSSGTTSPLGRWWEPRIPTSPSPRRTPGKRPQNPWAATSR